jgi:hypothetical protein
MQTKIGYIYIIKNISEIFQMTLNMFGFIKL